MFRVVPKILQNGKVGFALEEIIVLSIDTL